MNLKEFHRFTAIFYWFDCIGFKVGPQLLHLENPYSPLIGARMSHRKWRETKQQLI